MHSAIVHLSLIACSGFSFAKSKIPACYFQHIKTLQCMRSCIGTVLSLNLLQSSVANELHLVSMFSCRYILAVLRCVFYTAKCKEPMIHTWPCHAFMAHALPWTVEIPVYLRICKLEFTLYCVVLILIIFYVYFVWNEMTSVIYL